jgi:hypothetical protein
MMCVFSVHLSFPAMVIIMIEPANLDHPVIQTAI